MIIRNLNEKLLTINYLTWIIRYWGIILLELFNELLFSKNNLENI